MYKNKEIKNKNKIDKKAMSAALSQTDSYNEDEISSDILGSYTGVPTDDPYDRPIQDADDL